MTLFYFDYNCLQQVRRGADKAGIYSIALSPNIQWLAVSSDKGTVHIFSLRVRVVGEDRSTDSAVVRGPALCHQNSSNSLDALISSSTSSNPGSSLSFMKGRTYIWLYDLFFCKVLLHWVARRLLVAAWFEMTNGREIHSLIFMLMGPFYLDLFFYARLKGFSFFLWCLVKWFCIKIEKKNLASSFCLSSPHFHCVLCDFPIDLTWYHKTMLNCLINKLNLLEWVQFYLVFNMILLQIGFIFLFCWRSDVHNIYKWVVMRLEWLTFANSDNMWNHLISVKFKSYYAVDNNTSSSPLESILQDQRILKFLGRES